jgi:hypothetical protein
MPNFDGTGPLKRGRAIGRGLGTCKKSNGGSSCLKQDASENKKETPDTE